MRTISSKYVGVFEDIHFFSLGMTKGTKTITFTLESPGEVEQSWAVQPNSSDGNYQQLPKKKKRISRRRKTVEKINVFPPETLQRLKSVSELINYAKSVILPNVTFAFKAMIPWAYFIYNGI